MHTRSSEEGWGSDDRRTSLIGRARDRNQELFDSAPFNLSCFQNSTRRSQAYFQKSTRRNQADSMGGPMHRAGLGRSRREGTRRIIPGSSNNTRTPRTGAA